MQGKTNKFDESSIKDYYSKLTKGEKSKLIAHLCNKYQLVASTMQAKFRGYSGCHFTPLEISTISTELRKKEWQCLTK